MIWVNIRFLQYQVSSVKKVSCREDGGGGGGVFSQKRLMSGGDRIAQRGLQPKSAHTQGVGWGMGQAGLEVPIMHCCLHVISLLTCYQKEELAVCTAYIAMLQGILGNYPSPQPPHPPTPTPTLPPSDIGTTAVCGKQSRFVLPSSLYGFFSYLQKFRIPDSGSSSHFHPLYKTDV